MVAQMRERAKTFWKGKVRLEKASVSIVDLVESIEGERCECSMSNDVHW
jgi:hypothetical protein